MIAVLRLVSRLPFSVLHRVSDLLFLILYYGLRYRRTVVRENLARAFPEKTEAGRAAIEKHFYRNFTDILIETIKAFTLSEEELRSRIRFVSGDLARDLWQKQVNVAGISSHLANWEFLAQSLALDFEHMCYGVYKPLSAKRMNEAVVSSRERFGMKLVPMMRVRRALKEHEGRPYLLGLLSDQAPHDYEKAFEVVFLGQKTFVVPGPGILTVQLGLTPIWGWMRRIGRSQFEWGAEVLSTELPEGGFSESDREQIARIARVHRVTPEQAGRALALIQRYSERLEAQIKMAPQDWLWSHRRWKSRG